MQPTLIRTILVAALLTTATTPAASAAATPPPPTVAVRDGKPWLLRDQFVTDSTKSVFLTRSTTLQMSPTIRRSSTLLAPA